MDTLESVISLPSLPSISILCRQSLHKPSLLVMEREGVYRGEPPCLPGAQVLWDPCLGQSYDTFLLKGVLSEPSRMAILENEFV